VREKECDQCIGEKETCIDCVREMNAQGAANALWSDSLKDSLKVSDDHVINALTKACVNHIWEFYLNCHIGVLLELSLSLILFYNMNCCDMLSRKRAYNSIG